MSASDAAVDPARAAARAARLRYVNAARPGISRERRGEDWVFRNPDGSEITDEAEIARIRKLAVPPAYTDVWICREANGHLQAVGRDARGRLQYRYHARWRQVRDEAKYGKMLVFGEVLPRIRAQVRADMALPGMPKRKVLAAIVTLLEKTMMRVGNEEYARTNQSYGLTTLQDSHARVRGAKVTFDFKGKHGIAHHIDLQDRKLAKIVQQSRDLPGQDLFQFVGDDGAVHDIESGDVNDYLREISGHEVTAKDFRTWAATNLAALALAEMERVDGAARQKKAIVEAVESVAKKLGNTPAICRKCYIHPAVFDGYLDGTLAEGLKSRADEVLADPQAEGLTAEELAVTAYLAGRLEQAVDADKPVRKRSTKAKKA